MTREGVGIAVDSLDDIEEILGNMSTEDYQKMKARAAAVGKKLSKGSFTTAALSAAVKELGGEG